MSCVIGLTGGIAMGKSTVAKMFSKYHIPVVDADLIAREVVEKGQKSYEKIVRTFGKEILHEDLSINRKKLGQIIFADARKREQLNHIVHPAIREEMVLQRDRYVAAAVPAVVLDIPLLYESRLTHFVDKVIVVAIHGDLQLKRLMNRDQINEQEAKRRIQAQMPIEEKIKKADAVIYNEGSIRETEKQLVKILQEWNIIL